MIGLAALMLQAVSAPLTPAPAIATLPGDVRRFIARYDECQHWMGEEPYDADRKREIERGVAKSCKNIDPTGDRLKRRYARNEGVTAALVAYPPLTR